MQAQPARGTIVINITQGCEDRIGRLNVASAEAAPLTNQTRALIPGRRPSDAARSQDGNRQWIGSPSSVSTRSDEIPGAPAGPLSSNASSAEASGAGSPALAATAARSALS